ncbi:MULTISPECIES: ABC transporter permease [unclassified Bosea (in: a-proteobacteria)]|uniref:ABC transporter permease n=1 Tax=unclassified Bosea (in: a-proteobacteria) TaxID=2653178 RepID=UPI000F75BB39|nr:MULTISPECIES: ABC transporter permease [unclassified Bosea (in: a-proteobacteria)]AZO82137.1 peptide ABC transporter permease [Bosea sp. Tri-49]RXT20705.1 peptide ABC transporter permease [Bosea sp. Tri-39]RXT33746.1 peptide ABC transporter permease [Bosea sp. Tri-54]
MLRLIAGRIVSSIGTLLFVGLALFALTRSGPGSPARIVLGADATAEQIAQFEQAHGLDRPFLPQYAAWLGDVMRGDFGKSFVTGRDVATDIVNALPVTLSIVLFAFAIALVCGIGIGVFAALRPGGVFDRVSRFAAVLGLSIPAFWLGIVLIRFLAVDLRLLPPGGYAPLSAGLSLHLQSIMMPSLSLAVYYIAVLARMTQASLQETLRGDYVRTARAMGLSSRQVVFYALVNALPPVINLAALSFGYMFGWALIIEQVFNIPGLSRALLNAISQRDFLLLQGIVFLFTAIFVFANLGADLINRVLDPRQRATA